MEQIGNALYQAVRDNTTLRALVGNTTTAPYNCYHAEMPDNFNFTASNAAVTYHEVSETPDTAQNGTAARTSEMLYDFIVYARSKSVVESVHREIKYTLHDRKKVTQPSTLAIIHGIKFEHANAVQWDEAFGVFFQVKTYRVWGRDDDLRSS